MNLKQIPRFADREMLLYYSYVTSCQLKIILNMTNHGTNDQQEKNVHAKVDASRPRAKRVGTRLEVLGDGIA